jgi:hypothetical protein
MSSIIQNVLDSVIGDGARSTKFECYININKPGLIEDESTIFAQVKSSFFPGKSHTTIDLKYKGRNIPIKGQVKYDNSWSCTFYNTQDHKLKKVFEDWIESLDHHHNIKAVSSGVEESKTMDYASSFKIAQLDFDGSQTTAIYELFNVFPRNVSVSSADYSAVGEITEFTVEFSYSHFNTLDEKSNNGSFVDETKDKIGSNISRKLGDFSSNFSLKNRAPVGKITEMLTKINWD